MRVLYDSLIDSSLTYSTNSENANYLVENIYSTRLSKKYRTTDVTSEYIVMDAGAGNTIQANTFTISGHNFTSGATLKIQANATDAWGGPTLDETITFSSETMVAFFTLTDLRFWRFSMADAGNTDGYLEVGRLMLGEYLQITSGPARGITPSKKDTTEHFFSGSGQHYGTIGYKYREYKLRFPHWTNAMSQTVETMLDSVLNIEPVVMVLDESNTDILIPVYGLFMGSFDKTELQRGSYHWSSNLKFRECK